MIKIMFLILLISSMSIFVLVIFIKMIRQIPKDYNVEPTVIENKDSVNPKITKALEKGVKEQHDNLIKHSNSVQIEKERLLKDDYIYNKITNAISKNEYYFIISLDPDEITKDAINLIPGMKAVFDKLGRLIVTFPNTEK